MSDSSPDHYHANHVYELVLCDRMEWGKDLDTAVFYELKAGFRAKLHELFARDSGPWSHDLDKLSAQYGLESLHAIPERVHRELLQGWLDKLNQQFGPGQRLFASAYEDQSCCYSPNPPWTWHSCTLREALMGTDAKSAQPWMIKVTAGKFTKSIPVYIGACWTCEITHDGRPQRSGKKSGTVQA